MTLTWPIALWRAPISFAKTLRKQPQPAALPREINDRLARDIGLEPSDLERHRLVLPSQGRPLI